MGLFLYRLMGAATLDAGIYESIEADARAMTGAIATVVLASLAAGIGMAGLAGPRPTTLVVATIAALIAWLAWATLIQQVGGRHLRDPETRVTLGELLRTIGFAASPGLLQVFAVFPSIALPVYVISWTWMLAATVVAVKHALDLHSMARAVMVSALSMALVVAFVYLASLWLGPVS